MNRPLTLVLLCLVAYGSALVCPSGYTNHNGFCYKLYTTFKTREQAAFQCQMDGAILPTILNDDMNQFVFNYARQVGSVFLGLSCVNDQLNSCRFDDLNRLIVGQSYQNFYADRPVTKFGNCVWMEEGGHYSGEWASVDCANTTSAFVCQYYDYNQCNPATGSTPAYTWATTPSYPSNGSTWDGLCNAGRVLYTPLTIFTPNYPNNYIPNYGCLWHIHSVNGGPVNITITDLQIDGGTRIGIYAENDFNTPIDVINSNQATPIYLKDGYFNPTIVFETADYAPYRGFRAVITEAYNNVAPKVLKSERIQL